jgi:hypothetical protein
MDSRTPKTDELYQKWMDWGAGAPRPNGHMAKFIKLARTLELDLAAAK